MPHIASRFFASSVDVSRAASIKKANPIDGFAFLNSTLLELNLLDRTFLHVLFNNGFDGFFRVIADNLLHLLAILEKNQRRNSSHSKI